MATLLLTHGSRTSRGVKKRTLAERVTIGANTLVVIIIALIALVSVSYLFHSNKSAAKGYILKELKEEEAALNQQANYWALKVSREQSYKALKTSKELTQMAPATTLVYVDSDTEVALK